MSIRRFLIPLAALPLAACATGPAKVGPVKPARTVTVGIVGLNDFHGALEPPRTSVIMSDGQGGVIQLPAGGAAYLASAIDQVRGQYSHSLAISAGDMIGATQLSSSLFLDEPAVEVMNRLGLDFNAVGNHEFDRGRDELKRKQNGGCAQHTALKPCRLEPFRGAKFGYLAANSIE